ncbi:MAG TPA: MarR family transcriptional regulator [Thermomicrobiales bacterium]|nr:MarR family transcriptional regulator [Thermomicrobiales bacterium]
MTDEIVKGARMTGAGAGEGEETETETQPLLGALLRIPYQTMIVETIEPALAAAGFADIRSAHMPVLQALTWRCGGLRATELAAEARITKQSMGYLVDALEAGGYVERAPDPGDRRAKVVRLTAKGRAAVRTVRAAVRRAEADWGMRIGADRVAQLRSILDDLTASLEAESRRIGGDDRFR